MRWARMREEWQGNRRLRLGIAVVAVILVAYAVFALNDWRLALHEDYRQATLRLYKTAQLATETQWPQRQREAVDLRKALEAQVPAANSVGMAQADAQSRLQEMVQALGRDLVTDARPATLVDRGSQIWKVPLTVRGDTTPLIVMALLERIESGERLMRVEDLSIDNRQRTRVTMTVSFYYRIPAATQGGGDGAS